MTQAESRPRLSGKVSAELTEGASLRRNERIEIRVIKTQQRF